MVAVEKAPKIAVIPAVCWIDERPDNESVERLRKAREIEKVYFGTAQPYFLPCRASETP